MAADVISPRLRPFRRVGGSAGPLQQGSSTMSFLVSVGKTRLSGPQALRRASAGSRKSDGITVPLTHSRRRTPGNLGKITQIG